MLLTALGFLFRIIGLAEWFENWYETRQARKQAQYEANSPTTLSELQDAQRHGDF